MNIDEKRILLEDAREAISAELAARAPRYRHVSSPGFVALRGAFVTLHLEDALRGCIGHIEGKQSIRENIRDLALSSAFRDSRFPPLSKEELPRVDIEISLLTPLEEVPSPESFLPGRDGLLIELHYSSAVFLPQVAAEQGWDRTQTLTHLCYKAGLPADAWKNEEMKFYTFQAEVFSEKELL
jgi:AmmeMemoRadiSam system protein A